MSVRRIKAGTTDVSITLRIVDSTDGTPETGVVFNTAGIDLWYRREGAVAVDITEATLAALTTAHTDGGFLEIGDGWYRLDLPDAACASGVSGVQIGGTVTGMVVFAPYIELPVNTAEDVYTRLGAPVGASISADIATVDGNVDAILVDTGTTLQAELDGIQADTEDIQSKIGTPAGASLAADIAAIEAQTDDIGVAGAGLTAVPWNSAWDAEVQSEVADALAVYDPPTNAEMEARTLAAASYATATALQTVDDEIAVIDGIVDSILVDTAEIGAAGAGLTAINLPDQTMNITGNITGNLSGSVGSVTGAVGSVTGNVGGNVTGSVGSLAAQAKADVNAEVLDVLTTDTFAELAAVPAATSSLKDKINWIFLLCRNKILQTATTQTVRNDADDGDIATSTVSDDATTYTRGEFS